MTESYLRTKDMKAINGFDIARMCYLETSNINEAFIILHS